MMRLLEKNTRIVFGIGILWKQKNPNRDEFAKKRLVGEDARIQSCYSEVMYRDLISLKEII